ncbi:hypothetical protein O181_009599 [Austropuccinia psidii MF-1]|uniref:Uncharacterized protein n=1 Tax=Austropuccinia psidii MF-1 TaxID=1389203 RepID=A0A9Q3GK08_9BASI|nr:hypothetical protein [Austropuccinia psidii MF-1]
MMKAFPSANGLWDHRQADKNASAQLAQLPPVFICPPSDGHFTPPPEQSVYWDGGKRTFELGLIVTHGIQMQKTNPTESPSTSLSHSIYAL